MSFKFTSEDRHCRPVGEDQRGRKELESACDACGVVEQAENRFGKNELSLWLCVTAAHAAFIVEVIRSVAAIVWKSSVAEQQRSTSSRVW